MHTSAFWKPKSITLFYFLKYETKEYCNMIEEKLQATSKYWTVMFNNLLIFLPIYSPQDKNSLSILSCHFIPIQKIEKKLLNIFRNLFLQYISCTLIWICQFLILFWIWHRKCQLHSSSRNFHLKNWLQKLTCRNGVCLKFI